MRIFAARLPLVVVTLLCLSFAPNAAIMFAAGGEADPALYSNDWRTTGPPGGDVRALVVDPSNPDRFYFGTLDGQIYTSADAGKSWQLLHNLGRPRLFVDHIIVDPRNPKVLYVGAHRHDVPGGFFKDEAPDELGTTLLLPPWFEDQRAAIVARLEPITVPEENRPKGGTAAPRPAVAATAPVIEESKIPLSRYKATFGADEQAT